VSEDPSLEAPRPKGPRDDPFAEGPEAARARRLRSLVIAVALLAFVALVFVTSILKLAQNAALSNAAHH
jgi:hypothetical protein